MKINSNDYDFIIDSLSKAHIISELERLEEQKEYKERMLPPVLYKKNRGAYPSYANLKHMKEWIGKCSDEHLHIIHQMLLEITKQQKQIKEPSIKEEPVKAINPKPLNKPTLRTLSLGLDEFGYESLALLKRPAFEIDRFTSYFESHEALRELGYIESEHTNEADLNNAKKMFNYTLKAIFTNWDSLPEEKKVFYLEKFNFKKRIAEYLSTKEALLTSLRTKKGNTIERGSIMLLEKSVVSKYNPKDLSISSSEPIHEKPKVLYKNDIIRAEELVYDKEVMKKVPYLAKRHLGVLKYAHKQDENLMHNIVEGIIHNKKYPTDAIIFAVKKWLNSEPEVYYEKLRLILKAEGKAYKNGRKEMFGQTTMDDFDGKSR